MNIETADDLRTRIARDWPDHAAQLIDAYPVTDDVDRQLAALYSDWAPLLIGYWARFAATGDSNGDGVPGWPRYTQDTDQHLTLDTAPSVASQLRRAQYDTWDRLRS